MATNRTHSFSDGNFTFWTAHFGAAFKDARIVFRVRDDNDPETRAGEKGIRRWWDRLLPATEAETAAWMNHKQFFPLG